ncbi:MAG: prepilin-type N-terminal cleavage/methylation domain-containing protein [Clostridia bacterium]|nr:prepilin-type N-terminal cleavage/methylation domain-containing protein [Clostridia bacterium]
MLKAKLDSVRKNKKGFSLVELIIVIAIMVALIAVMAPNFVKYVQKSRDTALQTAAEDFLASAKVAYGDPESTYSIPTGNNVIKYIIKLVPADGKFKLSITGGDANGTATTGDDLTNLIKASGADTDKYMGKTTYVYTITISDGPTFKMTSTSTGGAV